MTDNDRWDFYMTLVDGDPASIFVNMSLAERAPIVGQEHFLFVQIPMLDPRADGLSSTEEFDALIALEDKIIPAVEATGAATYSGRNTHNGTRDLFFYVADPAAVVALVEELAPTLEPYDIRCGHNHDPLWNAYFDFLYPDPENLQHMNNRSVLRQLAEHGDDHTAPREIDHFAYFDDADSAAAFAAEIDRQRFEVVEEQTENEAGQICVAFKREDSLTDIDEVTINLAQLANEHGGFYDGWGSPVIAAGQLH